MFVHLEVRIRLPLCEMWLLQSQLTITSLIKSNWKNRKHPSYSQLEEHLQSTEHRSPILLQYANLQAQPQLCLDLLLVLIKSYFDYTLDLSESIFRCMMCVLLCPFSWFHGHILVWEKSVVRIASCPPIKPHLSIWCLNNYMCQPHSRITGPPSSWGFA